MKGFSAVDECKSVLKLSRRKAGSMEKKSGQRGGDVLGDDGPWSMTGRASVLGNLTGTKYTRAARRSGSGNKGLLLEQMCKDFGGINQEGEVEKSLDLLKRDVKRWLRKRTGVFRLGGIGRGKGVWGLGCERGGGRPCWVRGGRKPEFAQFHIGPCPTALKI